MLPTTDALDHARDAIVYMSALGWTQALLPSLGGPTLRSVPELMHHKFYYGGPPIVSAADERVCGSAYASHRLMLVIMCVVSLWQYVCFVYAYTLAITAFCLWCNRVAALQANAMRQDSRSLLGALRLCRTLVACCLDTLSKSVLWIAVWALMAALLGTLPTQGPLEALLSAAAITTAGAYLLLAGQRGSGPFGRALRRTTPDRLQWFIFFCAWMVAVAWVGALTACVEAGGVPPLAAAWLVAGGLVAARWAWLWRAHDPQREGGIAAALEVYSASVDQGLMVGLLVATEAAPTARALPTATALPTAAAPPLLEAVELHTLYDATRGLSALAGAWLGCVALQAASSALWSSADAWPHGVLPGAAAALLYAGALSYASVAAVGWARGLRVEQAAAAAAQGSIAEETRLLRRSAALAGESAALAVASAWAWFHALGVLLPPLSSSSVLVRTAAAVCLTGGSSMALLEIRGARQRRSESEAARGEPSPLTSPSAFWPEVETARSAYQPPRHSAGNPNERC